MELKDYLKKIRLSQIRKEVHFSAADIGVTPKMIYEYEKGNIKPGYDVLMQYVKYCADPYILLNQPEQVVQCE